jgi:RND superfamily putative drug exporter
MFRLLGNAVTRFWALVLVGWIFLLAASWWAAPAWNQVAQDKEFTLLPADSPSRRAAEMFAKAFPDEQLGSNVALVVVDNEGGHLERDRKFIEDVLEPRLRKIAEEEGGLASEAPPSEEPLFPGEAELPKQPTQRRSIISRIRTPNAPGSGALLVSADSKALLVVVELTTEFLANSNKKTIAKIENLVRELKEQNQTPPGVDIAATGSAVVGRDHSRAQLQSVRATETLTVVLVIVLLVLIYRAPLLALIPLATVYLAVQASRNILAIAAGAGYLTLFQGIQIYITILAYGAGVDYSLFLTARYKEELDHGANPRDAVSRAVGGVGAALLASAATVMCGIGMMVFAQFGKFREAGIAIPLSLLFVLCATLTFSPAFLRLTGRWAFWPERLKDPADKPEAPAKAFAGASGLSATLAAVRRLVRSETLRLIWIKTGQKLARRPGAIWLTTVGVMAPFAIIAGLLYNRLSYDLIGTLPPNDPSVVGTRVLQEHFPAGLMGSTSVLLVNPHIDFSSERGKALVKRFTDRLREQKEELGLADIRSLTAPLGITRASEGAAAGIKVSEESKKEVRERLARERYVTDLGERAKIGTRLDLILEQSPFSHRSIEDLDKIEPAIRAALPADLGPDSELYVVGTTASVRDLAAVMRSDRVRIEVLVLVSVFVILVLLLRQLVVSLYLLLSVLFSYYTTLGVAFVVFWLLDPAGFIGIDWKVAIFLFTILIAVGEDYNIFLIARVREEEEHHGPINGITEALTRTGPIITSCGIIMAGTFASLLAGSLAEMKQLGFALSFGILLDTFVVRPILVPAFLILLQTGRLSLSGRARGSPKTRVEARRPDRAVPST